MLEELQVSTAARLATSGSLPPGMVDPHTGN